MPVPDRHRVVITGMAVNTPLGDTLEGCERILADEFTDVPEKALYMIGRVDEVKKG